MTTAGIPSLGAVDGDGVGVGELIEVVGDLLVLVGPDREGVVFVGQAGDDVGGAVEDPGGALVVVVAQLGHLVADAEDPSAVAAFLGVVPAGGEGLLQRPGRAGARR